MTSSAVRDFLLRLAPELGEGLYVVFLSDTGAVGRNFLGCSSSWLTGTLARWCEPWRGPAPAILLNNVAIQQEADAEIAGARAEAVPVDAEEVTRSYFLRTAVHELGHMLTDAPPYVAALPVSMSLERVLEALADPATLYRGSPPPWINHKADWLRLALHLRARAEALGVHLSAYNLIDGFRYGLSHPDAYRFRLGDEPERLGRATFECIKATPPPADFLRLWKEDTAETEPARAVRSAAPTEGK